MTLSILYRHSGSMTLPNAALFLQVGLDTLRMGQDQSIDEDQNVTDTLYVWLSLSPVNMVLLELSHQSFYEQPSVFSVGNFLGC